MSHKERLETLEDAYGHLGSVEMLCQLDSMIHLPQTPAWLAAITDKRNRVQSQLEQWGRIVRKE